MHSTAANKVLAIAPNEPPSLYQATHCSLTRWACWREGITYLNNSPRRWAELPLRPHGNSAPQLSSNELMAPSVHSLAMVHASPTILHINLCRILQTILLHSFNGNPLQMMKLPRPYLKSYWLSVVAPVQLSQWRSPALPTGLFRPRATRTPFGTERAPSLRGRLRMVGSPTPRSPYNVLGRCPFLPNLERGPVGGVGGAFAHAANRCYVAWNLTQRERQLEKRTEQALRIPSRRDQLSAGQRFPRSVT